MDNNYFVKHIRLVANESSSKALKEFGKEGYDISGGNPTISYHENIGTPSLSVFVRDIIDVDQFVSKFGITGGEYLTLKVQISKQAADEGQKDFEITTDHNLILNQVFDISTTSLKQKFSLEFVSAEDMVNETARLSKRFDGNIADIVKDILTKDKRGIQTKKKLKKDRSLNKYTFVGNLKRPFDTVRWLSPKASSDKEDCGFLFYENLEGYHFKSIKKLLETKPKFTYKRLDKTVYEADTFSILDSKVLRTNDIGLNLRIGTYASRTIYVDLENQQKTVVDYKISDNTGIKNPPKLPEKLDEYPSRLMFRLVDPGAMQKGSKRNDKQKDSELAKYQNKSYARNNLLNSYTMNIMVSFNTDLRVGDMIEIKLPYKSDERNTKSGKTDFSDVSGKYLISKLMHMINADRSSSTHLEIIRDTFSAK